MKSIGCTIIILALSICTNAQESDTIIRSELENILIRPSKKSKDFCFDLTGNKRFAKRSAHLGLVQQYQNTIGIFVPIEASKFLSIAEVTFPYYQFESDTSIYLKSYINLKYADGSDSIIEILPQAKKIYTEEMSFLINAYFQFVKPIIGYYFFIKSDLSIKDKTNPQISFSNKYKSNFTYFLDNNNKPLKANISNYVAEHATTTISKRSLNWSIKICYEAE